MLGGHDYEICGREKVLKTAIDLWKQSGIEYGENAVAHIYESIGMQKVPAILEKSYQQITEEFAKILNS